MKPDLDAIRERDRSIYDHDNFTNKMSSIINSQKDIPQLLAHIDKLIEQLEQAKNVSLNCVNKIKSGLGAGGKSTGMYLEVELGNAICDALTDAIEEEFDQEDTP